MRFKARYIILLAVVFITLMGISCTKVKIQTTGGVLTFSVDTLKFDTVFTAEGSFTTSLVIYNPQNEEVAISSVKLNEGANSFFHLNVDGFAGNSISNQSNLKIAAHDSMYVFATVNINPNNKTNPFVVTDSLVVTMNGKNFYVPFTAYGQNAHYIVDSALTTNATWGTDGLPYVIIWNGDTTRPRGLQINPGYTLTLNQGCQVYVHQNACMAVFGNLLSNGTLSDSVVIKGDRPDPAYWGWLFYPGEWGGMYFGSHTNSSMNYTRVENGGNGVFSNIPAEIIIYADSSGNLNYNTGAFTSGAAPQLFLNHCIIENSFGYGIYNWQGSLVASNCNINTTGQQALAIVQGGYDSITNCTFANYGNTATGLAHSEYGTAAILDYYWDGVPGDPTYYGGLNAVLRNCIVYGSLDSEIVCDATGTPSNYTTNLLLDHCLLSIGTLREGFVTFDSCIINLDPQFKNSATGDFHLNTGSPAIDSGTVKNIAFPFADLDGNAVSGPPINIGCYQNQ